MLFNVFVFTSSLNYDILLLYSWERRYYNLMKNSKLIISVILFMLLIGCGISANSAEIVDMGKCGTNLSWTLNDEGLLTIDGEGDMQEFSYYDDMWPDTELIKNIIISPGVTSIAPEAFIDCTQLESIHIPPSITYIGEYAFCSSKLKKVYITDVTAWCSIEFSNSYSNPLYNSGILYVNDVIVKDLTIPLGVTAINNYAFYHCISLTNVYIPNSVTEIGNNAFNFCSKMESVNIPNSVISIGDYAFCYCMELNQLSSMDNISYIGKYAFQNCNQITNFVIPNGVTSISEGTFKDCINLSNVTIHDGVTSIGNSAFSNCQSLAEIVIPESVTSIGSSAFSNCKNLKNINIPDGITTIAEALFSYCINLKEVILPQHITSIHLYAFDGCNNLTNINIPESVTEIQTGAFRHCGISSITIPKGITNIYPNTFYNCQNLKEITLPESIDFIQSNAFYNCVLLTDVYYYGSDTSWQNNVIVDSGNEYLQSATMHYLQVINPERIVLSESHTSLELYSSLKLIASIYPNNASSNTITWTSSNENIATVVDGIVTANSIGEVTITASIKGLSASCVVKIIPKQPKISELNVIKWGDFALIELIACNLPEHHKIFVAAYKENGSFSTIIPIFLDENNTAKTVMLLSGESTFKAFVWKDLLSIQPICKSVSTEIQQSL